MIENNFSAARAVPLRFHRRPQMTRFVDNYYFANFAFNFETLPWSVQIFINYFAHKSTQ